MTTILNKNKKSQIALYRQIINRSLNAILIQTQKN